MLPSRYFIDLTQPEIAAQLKKNPLVILPQGSVEQHGPHLPTGTDIFASSVIAHAVAERMDGLVLPGGPLGVTPLHMPFEGTITLTPDTYMRVVTETCASTARHGAKYLLILNWHELNIPPLGVAADLLHREYGMTVLTVQACFVAEIGAGDVVTALGHANGRGMSGSLDLVRAQRNTWLILPPIRVHPTAARKSRKHRSERRTVWMRFCRALERISLEPFARFSPDRLRPRCP